MPAFSSVLLKVLESNSVDQVLMVFFVKERVEFSLNSKYSNKLKCHQVTYRSNIELFLMMPFIMIWLIYLVLINNTKVVFGHGAIGAIGGLLSMLTKRKYVQRIYGSFLIDEINSSEFALFMRHPLDYLSFKLPSHRTVITNDGTHGDLVFNKLNRDSSRLDFLLNGVNKMDNFTKLRSTEERPLITYIARVDKWKRAHLFAEALIRLKKDFSNNFEALIIGPIINKEYANYIQDLIDRNGLTEQISIVGAVNSIQAKQYLTDSTLTCSFYQTSNLGNVFLESLTLGVPMLAINCNNSLEAIDVSAYEECTESPAEIAVKMNLLINDEVKRMKLSDNAKKWANSNLTSWDERSSIELTIIQNILHD